MTRRKKNPALVLSTALQAARTITDVQAMGSRARRNARRSEVKTPAKPKPTRTKRIGGVSSGMVVAAPISASTSFRGPEFSFGAAPVLNGMKGLRLHAKQVWGYLNSNSSGKTLFKWIDGVTFSGGITFDPNDAVSMPPPLVLLSQVFGRYVLRKARVTTTPGGVGTLTNPTNPVGIALSVFTDAAMVGPTTAEGILQESNSVSGPAWESQSLEVPCDGQLRFMFQSGSDAAITTAERRQDHAFALYGQFDTTPAASTFYGWVHLEYVIDLYECTNPPLEASIRFHQAALTRCDWKKRAAASVERKTETSVREEKKAPISSSLEVHAQRELSGGWSVVPAQGQCDCEGLKTGQHAFNCAGYSRPVPLDPTPRRVQSTKS